MTDDSGGFKAVEFAGGEAALGGIDDTMVAVCLDLGLDDLPGVEVLRRLKFRQPDVPVVIVTAHKQIEDFLHKGGSKKPGPGGPPGGGQLDQRPGRQLRWTLLFNTHDGRDYLLQLHSLGAILAIPGEDDQLRLVRDLLKRPVQLRVEDLGELDRIYWIDRKPESVQSLTLALGLALSPKFIAAFFPAKLEKELLDKELRYLGKRGTEDDIKETVFRVVKRGDRYEAVVVEQKLKNR